MIFRLLQVVVSILLLIYYGTILVDVFTNGKYSLTDYDLGDWHVWIPFYMWFKPQKGKKK